MAALKHGKAEVPRKTIEFHHSLCEALQPTILLLDYVIPPLLLYSVTEKTDLIVDHKNDALSCKFNRSGIYGIN